jgi:hypothetical protein
MEIKSERKQCKEMKIKRLAQQSVIAGMIAVGASIGVASSGVGTANAYPGGDYNEDSSFLASIRSAGIRYNDSSKPIALAHSICDARATGVSGTRIMDQMDLDLHSVMSEYQIGYFYGSSVSFYCPQLGV